MATKTTAVDRLINLSWRVGCPQEQLTNFLRAGYVPQPKQLVLHATARECDSPDGPDQVAFGGSRGPGKSHAVFSQIALDDCQRLPGLKCLYLRKIAKQAKEQLEDLRRVVLSSTSHEYTQSGVITFPNGSRIIIGHFKDERDIDNYLGIEYDVIAIEEATTLTRTKFQALRDSNRTSKPGWRPRVYLTFNPGGVGHAWAKERFIKPWRSGTETYTRFIPATVDDNVFVDPDYKRKLEENTGWRLRAYRHGDWDIAAGQFFSTWRDDIHAIDPIEIPTGWRKWAAMDYGFTHPTVVHIGAQDGDGNLYVIAEHRRSKWLVPQHANAIKEMLGRLGLGLSDMYTFVAGADVFAKRGTTAATIADLYKEEGIRLRPARDDRISGAGHLMALLGDSTAEPPIPAKLFVFKTCPHLIEQLPAMEHDPNNPEDVLKVDVDEDGNGGDDAYDGLRYWAMAVHGTSKWA